MVTCYLRYVIDAARLAEFERYAKLWIPLVEKFGGYGTDISCRLRVPAISRSLYLRFRVSQRTKPIEPSRSLTQSA